MVWTTKTQSRKTRVGNAVPNTAFRSKRISQSTVFVRSAFLLAPLLGVCLNCAVAAQPVEQTEPTPLHVIVNAVGPAKLATGFAKHARRRATAKVDEKALADEGLLAATQVQLSLFPDVELTANIVTTEQRGPRDYSWFGRITKDPTSHVIVSVNRGQVSAIIDASGRSYLVLPLPDGALEILELDDGSFPEGDDTPDRPEKSHNHDDTAVHIAGVFEEVAGVGDIMRLREHVLERAERGLPDISVTPDDGSEIDIIVAYTPFARDLTDPWLHPVPSALLSAIQLAIDQANLSFVLSAIPTRLNLVAEPFEVPYGESGSMTLDLDRLQLYGDNHLDGLHFWRNVHAADIVTLITTGGINDQTGELLCGLAFYNRFSQTPEENAAEGFNVVNVDCLANKTLVHEYGHNLGADHDEFVFQGTAGVVIEARGHVIEPITGNAGLRTIMAYNNECKQNQWVCPRIIRWSDPAASIDGRPLGVPVGLSGAANNRAAMTEPEPTTQSPDANTYEVANYRLSACRFLSSC